MIYFNNTHYFCLFCLLRVDIYCIFTLILRTRSQKTSRAHKPNMDF